MTRPLFSGLSPNAESDDIVLACKQFLKPWTWRCTEPSKNLETFFREWLGITHAFAFDSGRTSLFAILSALQLQSEDEVLLQSYTCVAVPNPILWTKARPIYVDIDARTFNMSPEDLRRKITPRSRALIIQHTFGQPAPLKELLEIAKAHNLFVIEDCAHALGARYDGALVGTFGDASFFSFGRDKVLSSIFGGLLVVKDKTLAERIALYQTSLPQPNPRWIAQQLLHPLLAGIAKATFAIGLGKLLLFIGRKTRLISQPVEACEKQGVAPSFLFHRFPGALATLALHQLQKRERFQEHRTLLAARYTEGLREASFKLPESPANTSSAWLRYTIQTPRAAEILPEAKREQIYLGDWYATPIAPSGVNYERICYHECPVASAVALTTVNLPTDIHITPADADRIILFLQRFV